MKLRKATERDFLKGCEIITQTEGLRFKVDKQKTKSGAFIARSDNGIIMIYGDEAKEYFIQEKYGKRRTQAPKSSINVANDLPQKSL